MSLRIDDSSMFTSALQLNCGKAEDGVTEGNGSTEPTTNGGTPSPETPSNTFDIEAQQKAFQRFTSSLGLGGFRSAFNMNVLPPFLAALQQNPLALQQQLLGLTGGLSGVSPGPDEEDEMENGATTEPEDLTMSFRKDPKLEDHHGEGGTSLGGSSWSYEEQFKQLYELSDDTKRKEWLDDWLSFMHRIGKPVTRIPIMAKQVLDLYELYRLVVQHGGLVEIINKKLWREITKGLNLPSSITSAAFTLRTQYQKYLYDYECEKEALSNPSDLQAAIDGNRREGRRNASAPNFGPLGYPLPHASTAANLLTKPFNGLGMRNEFMDDENGLSMSLPQNNLLAAYRAEQMAMFEAQQRQMERAQRAAAEAVARHGAVTLAQSGRASPSSVDSEAPAKRARLAEPSTDAPASTGGQMKITTRKPEGQQADNSMVVSMEINGVTYQGVLFALEDSSKT
ncbi:hypothetical protein V3C99_003833 [Haemonchus contortus]|uniref:ARID domain-containing protein n=1 Tax=Haemonchus contortus TaxID=6289 RepID=A0A7I4XZ81_HAECO|nr:AT-rich interaction region domain containing protein [Haemonchus contortus]